MNSVLLDNDGNCRCYADGMLPLPLPCRAISNFLVRLEHALNLHTVFEETSECAPVGTRRRFVEFARDDEQQMSGWPVDKASRSDVLNASVKGDREAEVS